MTLLTIVVVNRDRRDLLAECLEAIARARAQISGETELVVFDNGSVDDSCQYVRSAHPDAKLIALDCNSGFAPAIVEATARASGEWIALVNNDAFVESDCLRLLLEAGEEDDSVGAVTAQVRFVSLPTVINTAGLEIDSLGIAYDRLAGRAITEEEVTKVEVFGVSACIAIYRTQMLESIGGFDSQFFAYAEDADVAWRARMLGWKSLYAPQAVAFHHGSATAGAGSAQKYRLVGRNRVRLIARNATTAQLVRWGWLMILYDIAYVVMVAAQERTLAPLAGRFAGLIDWRAARDSGVATRRPVQLAGLGGPKEAFRMRRAYKRAAAASHAVEMRDATR